MLGYDPRVPAQPISLAMSGAFAFALAIGERVVDHEGRRRPPRSRAARCPPSEVEMSVAAAGEAASLPITASASSVGFCSRSTVSGPERICAPADSISALTQTVKPSYLLAWTWICPAFPRAQLLGLVDHLVPGRRRLRHQVLAVPEQLGVGVERRGVELALEGGGLDHVRKDLLGDLLVQRRRATGLIQPALANSRGPDHVHADDVDRSSPWRRAGGRAARAAGWRRSAGVRRRSCSGRSTRRVQRFGDLLDRAAGLVGDEPVEGDRAAARRACHSRPPRQHASTAAARPTNRNLP